MQELFGRHTLRQGMEDIVINLGPNRLVMGSAGSAFSYKRYVDNKVQAESIIISDRQDVVIGVFPIPPLWTPKAVSKNVYLKFKSHVILDQKSESVVYSKIPIEIGVYRQSGDEELVLDTFSLARQQFALYGPPDTGIVCRFKESEVVTDETKIDVKKYEEALVRIRISNMIDNVVKIGRVIIPMEGVVLDHAHDDAWVPGSVEMRLDMAFGKDVISIRLLETKAKRPDKTSLMKKDETLTFLMDAGY
ncbi:MAG: DUF432 domain-containing protein [Nitrososphaera sp.]